MQQNSPSHTWGISGRLRELIAAYRHQIRAFRHPKFPRSIVCLGGIEMQKQLFEIRSDLSGSRYCVAFNCRKTARAVTRFYDLALTPSGIRSTQFAILVGIAKSQPVSIGGLSDMLSIDTTTLTRSLHLMRRQGLLRVSERSTMRRRFVTLTRTGARIFDRSIPLWRRAQTRLVSAIGEARWMALQQQLEQLSSLALRLEKGRRTIP